MKEYLGFNWESRVGKVGIVTNISENELIAKREALEARKNAAQIEIDTIMREEQELILLEQDLAQLKAMYPQPQPVEVQPVPETQY